MLGAAGVVWPYLKVQGTVVQPFMPIFATTVTLTEALTAFLLWTQYRASGRLVFLALASAYSYSSVTAAVQLVVFPGAFSVTGPLGAGRQTAIWVWLLWHGGFPLLVTFALVMKSQAPIDDRHQRKWRGSWAIGGTIGLAIVLCLVVASTSGLLPNLVTSDGCCRHLSAGPAALSVWALCSVALVFHVFTSRLRTSMDLWLAVALLAGLVDVTLTLGAGARYSVGWYAARVASMVSSCTLLGMLMHEASGLYRKLTHAHRALKVSSVRDGLTGVFNRAYFNERYPREIDMAIRSALPLSVLLVDVDHFKAYNDTFGHLAGDECLRQVAQTLDAALKRQGDFVARYGGEEFVVVFPGCDAAAAMGVAERSRRAVEDMNLPGSLQGEPYVTVSIGYASCRGGAESGPEVLLAIADAALYEAKSCGRNRVRG